MGTREDPQVPNYMQIKVCPRCKERPRAQTKTGRWDGYCKPCRNGYQKDYQKTHRRESNVRDTIFQLRLRISAWYLQGAGDRAEELLRRDVNEYERSLGMKESTAAETIADLESAYPHLMRGKKAGPPEVAMGVTDEELDMLRGMKADRNGDENNENDDHF